MNEFKLTYKAPLPEEDHDNDFQLCQRTIEESLKKKTKLAVALIDAITQRGDAVLVFSRRIQVLKTIQSQRNGILMTGEEVKDPSKRQSIVDEFQNGDCLIFYMTTQVGGVGLNLFKANRIMILDPSWNPVDDRQACFRAYRYGQTKPVTIYRFIVKNSVEERMYRLAVHKNLAACRIVDEKDVERHFTKDQLKALDAYKDEPLKTTPDKVLNSVMHLFTSCSSHDVLFAESISEKLTEEELAEILYRKSFSVSRYTFKN